MRYKILSHLIIIIPTLFVLISCGESDDISKIKIGMTYDEVENLLGKPSSISRGANELFYDVAEIDYDLLQRLSSDTTKAMLDESRWFAPHQIKTVGNLIYVNWVYDKTKSDTFFVLLNNIKQQRDTSFIYGVILIEHNEVIESIEKVYYEVGYQYSVIFDTSSGRITSSGYYPFFVKKLHSKIIKEEGYL